MRIFPPQHETQSNRPIITHPAQHRRSSSNRRNSIFSCLPTPRQRLGTGSATTQDDGQTSRNAITSRLPNYLDTRLANPFRTSAGWRERARRRRTRRRSVACVATPSNSRLLGSCRIDHRTNSRDSIGRKTALLGVLKYRVFIGGNIYAVDSVVRDIALNPLNLSTHVS